MSDINLRPQDPADLDAPNSRAAWSDLHARVDEQGKRIVELEKENVKSRNGEKQRKQREERAHVSRHARLRWPVFSWNRLSGTRPKKSMRIPRHSCITT
ncbi:hypothetical protein Rt10032_c11g4419 [Rhodotorula toruloides]|uniref:Uncharacterized protein n=1 Tax=Rhodotorula toruloides TaxID=5286 RepID=A0A511KJ42_RHOTO|nr:hypothetical protein Rt10032_c11g4419 [Rhodotorula toruloides]